MENILVIEDEKDIRENIIQILQLNNYKTIFAENGETGLILTLESLPDLIICDIMMPCINGYEFLSHLRNNEKIFNIPCILLTGINTNTAMRKGMVLGADDYLTKPFNPLDLVESVKSKLEKQKNINKKYQALIEKNNQYIENIKKELREKQKELHNSRNIVTVKEQIIDRLLHKLNDPINKINLAINNLAIAEITQEERNKYLKILREEYSQEISLLNGVKHLQDILTPENILILQQYNFLNSNEM